MTIYISSIHSVIKTFQCEMCDKLFNEQGILRENISLIHFKYKTFGCVVWKEIFTGEDSSNNHMSSIHLIKQGI